MRKSIQISFNDKTGRCFQQLPVLLSGPFVSYILATVLVLHFMLAIPPHLFGSTATDENAISTPGEVSSVLQYHDDEPLALGDNEHGFLVSSHEAIVLTSEQSIRLLPGFKAEAGSRLVIKVTKKPQYGQQSATIAEVDEIVLHPVFLLVQSPALAESCYASLPDADEKYLAEKRTGYGIVPAQVQISVTGKQVITNQLTNTSNHRLSCSFSYQAGFIPSYGWGEKPENIRVLRT